MRQREGRRIETTTERQAWCNKRLTGHGEKRKISTETMKGREKEGER